MSSLVYGLLLAISGVGASLVLCRRRRVVGHIVAGFLLTYALRVWLVLVNETFGVFAPKQAGNQALDTYHRLLEMDGVTALVDHAGAEPFFVQALLNLPAFLVFGPTRLNLLLTNAFVGAVLGVVAAAYLERIGTGRSWLWGFWLFALFPAGVNFSFFGLRDPLVMLFVTIYALAGTLALFHTGAPARARTRHAIAAGFALLLILSLRIELAPVLLILPGWWAVRRLWEVSRAFASRFETWTSRLVLGTTLVAVFLPVALGIYRVAIAQLGAAELISPAELVDQYTAARYARAIGEGGAGSHIISPGLYASLPVPAAIALQTVGLIVLPLPWLLTDLTRWLAFGDSLVVIWCLWMVWRWGRKAAPELRRRAVTPLMVCFLLGILAMGFVVINAGNGFRMRLSLVPFLLAPTALAVERWRTLRAKTRDVAGAMEAV